MDYDLQHIEKLRNRVIERNYSLPAGFLELSPEYLAEHCNGIGAEWMPRMLRKLLTKALFLLEADSMVHDIEFLSTDKGYWKFTVANGRFALNAWKEHCFLSGTVAALICQAFGWSAWKEGKETMAYYYHFKEDENDGAS